MDPIVIVIICLTGACVVLLTKVWGLEKQLLRLHEQVTELARSTSVFAESVMDILKSLCEEDE